MEGDNVAPGRRMLLRRAAGIAAAAGLGLSVRQALAVPVAPLPTSGGRSRTPGKPGDFDWLSGEWRIRHRRLKSPGTDDWDEFEGEATCWGILGGIAHVEELRIPARAFAGMGLRLLDMDKRLWSDYWVNAKSGVLGAAGLTGSFEDGEGVFEAFDSEDGKPVIYRGVWDRIVRGKSHRWYQAASRDDGKTWDYTWFMDWTRA
jgi:hypothetical protein